MKLIIAEKPSLARNIAGAIGNMKKHPRHFEGGGYIVTWAFGHLFSLADIEHYSPNPDGENRWSLKNLPCFPEKFEFELKKNQEKQVDSGVRQQFETIRDLCNRGFNLALRNIKGYQFTTELIHIVVWLFFVVKHFNYAIHNLITAKLLLWAR